MILHFSLPSLPFPSWPLLFFPHVVRKFLFMALILNLAFFPDPVVAQVHLEPPSWITRQLVRLLPSDVLNEMAEAQYQGILEAAKNDRTMVSGKSRLGGKIQRISKRLIRKLDQAGYSQAQKWNWEVTTLYEDTVNAFCLPGGKIVIYTGLLQRLKLTDAEIAVILGHEMTHALREHGRSQMIWSTGTRIAVLALGYLVGLGDWAWWAMSYGSELISLTYGRDAEREADLLGMELVARAGYNPQASVTLWEKMAIWEHGQSKGFVQFEMFSSHPDPKNRLRSIKENLPLVIPLYK